MERRRVEKEEEDVSEKEDAREKEDGEQRAQRERERQVRWLMRADRERSVFIIVYCLQFGISKCGPGQ